jgi:hypothetical protein
MNRGFLQMIDLSTNIQRALFAVRGIGGGVAAIMAIGLTLLACGLLPLVWYLDVSATHNYAEPLITQVAPSLPAALAAQVAWIAVIITTMPTIVELFMPRIAERVPAVAFFVFGFILIDAITDYPRVAAIMQAYKPEFDGYGFVGVALWYVGHIPFLLFATLLAELLFVLCIVLVAVLVMKVFVNEEQLKRARLVDG